MIFHGKGLLAGSVVAAAAWLSQPALAQDSACGTDRTIDIAEMTWPSAATLAHVHATILEKGYGCNVKIVAGDTVPSSASMLSNGRPAVAPELWTSVIKSAWEKGLADGDVIDFGNAISDGTIEGWFIPRYVQEANPELKTALDVIARPDLFPDPENPGKGRLYSCPPGWACELSTSALFKAFDMDKEWNLFSPGSGGALDASIARAFLRKAPIVFYYWGPTSVLGKFDAVQLDLGEVRQDVYACNTDPACDKPPAVTAYPSSPAIVGAARWVKDEAPAIAEYFSKVGLTNAQISELLVYGDENKADAAATALNFLKTRQEIWKGWVPAEVAEKVEASLR